MSFCLQLKIKVKLFCLKLKKVLCLRHQSKSKRITMDKNEMKIVDYNELYQEIFKRIVEGARHKLIPPYKHIESLGFKSKQYYTIRKFVLGEPLDNGMIYPLGENNLKKLCSELGIKIHKPMCAVYFQ